MESFREKRLRRMSCAELRKYAKKHGIKANLKAEKIIEELLAKGIETEADFATFENRILNSCKKNKEKLFDKDQDALSYTPRRGTFLVEDEDSFVVLERQILNSCKKNKEDLFEKDKKTISETPRRETYLIDDPTEDIKKIQASSVQTSASPELKKSNESEIKSLNPGSAKPKCLSKRKVSFVTPLRRSTRISSQTPLYNSIKDRPKTPMPSKLSAGKTTSDLEDDAVVGSLNFDTSVNVDAKVSTGKIVKRPSTPMPVSRNRSRRISSQELPDDAQATPKNKQALDEIPHLQQLKEEDEVKETLSDAGVKTASTPFTAIVASVKKVAKTPPGFKKIATPIVRSQRTSPRSIVKSTAKANLSKITSTPMSGFKSNSVALALNLKKSAGKTPNFSKIHQKAFDKMESIDDYQKRKDKHASKKIKDQKRFPTPAKTNEMKRFVVDKAKNIPTFGGIPFVPVAAATRFKKLNVPTTPSSKPTTKTSPKEKVLSKKLNKAGTLKNMKKLARENSSIKQRIKFDLKASLSKKLPYKPHAGPLRPLGETNLNSTANSTLPLIAAKKPVKTENETVKAKRMQTRELLKGVRKNKRFLLQMNNRMMNVSSME